MIVKIVLGIYKGVESKQLAKSIKTPPNAAIHVRDGQQDTVRDHPNHLLFLSSRSFSLGSPMPSSLIANKQSLSGKQGLS